MYGKHLLKPFIKVYHPNAAAPAVLTLGGGVYPPQPHQQKAFGGVYPESVKIAPQSLDFCFFGISKVWIFGFLELWIFGFLDFGIF